MSWHYASLYSINSLSFIANFNIFSSIFYSPGFKLLYISFSETISSEFIFESTFIRRFWYSKIIIKMLSVLMSMLIKSSGIENLFKLVSLYIYIQQRGIIWVRSSHRWLINKESNILYFETTILWKPQYDIQSKLICWNKLSYTYPRVLLILCSLGVSSNSGCCYSVS